VSADAPTLRPEPVPLYLSPEAAAEARVEARDLPSWDLSPRQLCTLELLLAGACGPLPGYLGRGDHDAVLATGALADGTPCPWPLTLDVSEPFAANRRPGDRVALRDPEGLLVAILDLEEVWTQPADAVAKALAGAGAGVEDWLREECGPARLGGRLRGIERPCHYDFASLRAEPLEVRRRLHRMGWRRVLAVLTRRPLGPGEHALVMQRARSLEANVLLLVEGGMPDPGDLRYYARLRAAEAVLPRFSEPATELALVPLAPELGSPRERALRQLVARAYGATHVLLLDEPVEPSGVSGSEAPSQRRLGIERVEPAEVHYLPERGRYAVGPPPRGGEPVQPARSSELLERLTRGERVPEWLAWPEQVEALARAWPPRSAQGFTLFLTGLSGSGKSTIARALLGKLMESGGRRVTLLDGDIVRKHLSSELGFSREHRDLNILRIGFVASEITKNGGVAICAPIAPYAATRRRVRAMIEAVGGFVEIHVATPLEVCEARDRKGLYAKARAGLIESFTGISDPYEAPEQPELRLDTTGTSPDEAAQQVVLRLGALGYL
jgi:sulfate adenylyltransferase